MSNAGRPVACSRWPVARGLWLVAGREGGFADPEAGVTAGEWAGDASGEAGAGFVVRANVAEGSGEGGVKAGEPAKGAVDGASVTRGERQGEFIAQTRREPLSGEGAEPAGRVESGACSSEDGLTHDAGGGGDGELRGVGHGAGVFGEGGPVGREFGGGNAEEGGEAVHFLVVPIAIVGRQREDGGVGEDGAVDEGGKDPAEGGEVVGFIVGRAGPGAGGFGERALDGRVEGMELARGVDGLRKRSEDHGEDDAEGVVEAGDGAMENSGVIGDGGGDPGMGELEERGASSAEEDGGFARDAPDSRVGTEEASAGIGAGAGEGLEVGFEISGGDEGHRFLLWGSGGEDRGQVTGTRLRGQAVSPVWRLQRKKEAAAEAAAAS